jgi:hypothetical protein
VEVMLADVRLSAYSAAFSSEGYEFVVDLLEADREDLEELMTMLGMKKPERKRFERALTLSRDGAGAGGSGSAGASGGGAAPASAEVASEQAAKALEAQRAQVAEQAEALRRQQSAIDKKAADLAAQEQRAEAARIKAEQEAASLEVTPLGTLQPAAGTAKRPAMDQLLGMGFSEAQCTKALAEAGNVDAGVSYIFANADKPPEFWAESAAPAAAAAEEAAPAAGAAAQQQQPEPEPEQQREPAALEADLSGAIVVSTADELEAALADEAHATIAVKAGARIELQHGLSIRRSVRLVGAAGEGPLPAIVAPHKERYGITVSTAGVVFEMVGMRVEANGSDGVSTVFCTSGASLMAAQCEFHGMVYVMGDESDPQATHAELRDCTVHIGTDWGLYVYTGKVTMDGGTVQGHEQDGCDVGVYAMGGIVQMKGVTVQGFRTAISADESAAVTVESCTCTVPGSGHMYETSGGGRIEGVDQALVKVY